jgi:thiol:disulfide interchange protein DsbD
MKTRLLIVIALCLGMIGIVPVETAFAGFSGSPFQLIWDPAPIPVKSGEEATLAVTVRMPAGHFLYQDKTSLDFTSLEGVHVLKINYPKAVTREDPQTGHEAEVYEGEVEISARIKVPEGASAGEHDLTAILSYQGCSDKLCLRPEETSIQWVVQVAAAAAGAPEEILPVTEQAPAAETAAPEALFELPKTAEDLVRNGIGWAFVVAFIGGLLTSVTPCVLPLLPITLLVIGVGHHRRRHHNLGLALMLTLGMTVSYALMGSLAAVLGLQLGFLFQTQWFLALVIAFFVVMSAAMFEVIHLQVPLWLRNLLLRLGGQGPLGAFLAGISMGFLAAPCVGPVMGALLAFVGLTQNVWMGFLLMCSFALGMGTVFVVVGTFYGALSHHTRKPHIAKWVKRVLGVLLLLPALYYLDSFVPWMDKVPFLPRATVAWVSDESAVMAQAKALQRPIFVDFSAKWCAPCEEMNRTTFRDPRVIEKLATEWVAWKVDATFTTPEIEKILDRYRVLGWPTMIFLDMNGQEIPKSRRVGEVLSAGQLLQILDQLRK